MALLELKETVPLLSLLRLHPVRGSVREIPKGSQAPGVSDFKVWLKILQLTLTTLHSIMIEKPTTHFA